MLRALALTSLCACTVVPSTTTRSATPVDAALAAGSSANEIAQGSPDAVVFGWHLELIGETARFYRCDDATTCGMRLIEVPAKDVIATKVVGRARPTGADQTALPETEVLRITVARPLTTSRGGAAYDANRGLVVGGSSR
jgi:hypothetical protein